MTILLLVGLLALACLFLLALPAWAFGWLCGRVMAFLLKDDDR